MALGVATEAGVTVAAAAIAAVTAARPPERIGPYQIMQTLGEGGMGVVYLAEQEEPIKRRVALKLIKLGMDTREVVARFEAERQALALMDHPNIASVLDAGATPDGRPYFVMEYAPGIPITEYCDRHTLGTRQRLELFIEVCSAIQHAHQKGIIHRDLKPSNVLLVEQDGRPVPKVIDFGIAKATDQQLTEKTLFTQHGLLIGTPEYMSPEQAGLGAIDIDTRTDIYSLGVILYELLVGALPFSATELRQAGYGELLRMVREQEPVRPSTHRLKAGAATGLAADLDWITLKALEKDRRRRYATAAELAADLQRHLADEPVIARPPSTAYRVGKFVRRNRLAVTAASLVAVAVIAGLIVSLAMYMRAERLRRDADAQRLSADRQRTIADEQRRQAVASRVDADHQRGRAEKEAAAARLASAEASAQRSAAELQAYWASVSAAASSIREGNLRGARDTLNAVNPQLRAWEWQYLSRQADWPPVAFAPGESPFGKQSRLGVVLSPTELHSFGDLYAFPRGGAELVVSDQVSVTRWDRATGRRLRTDGPFRWVMALSDDATLIADRAQEGNSVTVSKSIVLYEIPGRIRRHIFVHDSDVTAAAFAPDAARLAIGTASGSVYLWNTRTSELIQRLTRWTVPIRDVAFDSGGGRIAIATHQSIALLDDRGTELRILDEGAVRLRFTRDGRRLAVAVADATPAMTASRDAQDREWMDVSQRYGGRGALSRTIRVWDPATGLQVSTTPLNGQVLSLALSPDGVFAATTAFRAQRTWLTLSSVSSGAVIASHPVMSGAGFGFMGIPFSAVAFTPEGELMTSDQSSVVAWPAGITGPILRPGVRTMAISDDGALMALGLTDGSIQVRRAPFGEEVQRLRGPAKAVSSVAFASARRIVASDDSGVRVWDVGTGKEIAALADTGVSQLSVGAGDAFATVAKGIIRIHDTATARELSRLTSPYETSRIALFRRPPSLVVGKGSDVMEFGDNRSAKKAAVVATLWDPRRGRVITEAPGYAGENIEHIAVSPDGSRIALVGTQTVSFWTGAFERNTAASNLEDVFSFSVQALFTPDGRRVLTRHSTDMRVWDPETGRLVLTISEAARAWAMAPDGSYLAFIDGRGYGRVLRASTRAARGD